MKQAIKTTVMALVAMFAFSTVADAQFGSLNSLRKGLGIKTKKEKAQEKALEELRHKQDSIDAHVKSITPTIPQPRADAKPIGVKWNKNSVGEWDPATLKLTFNQTYDEGEYAGQKVQFTLDATTGKWTNIAGREVGSMSNDGTLETPNLGTIKLDPKTGLVWMEGEPIGKAGKTEASCYGYTMGGFDDYVSPLLMAYVVHGTMLSKEQVGKLKVLKLKADEEAAAQAQARAEAAKKAAAQRSSSSSSSSSATQVKYTALYYNGTKFTIDSGNTIRDNGSQVGNLQYGGYEVTVFSKKEGAVAWIRGGSVSLNSRYSSGGSGKVSGSAIYLNASGMF